MNKSIEFNLHCSSAERTIPMGRVNAIRMRQTEQKIKEARHLQQLKKQSPANQQHQQASLGNVNVNKALRSRMYVLFI